MPGPNRIRYVGDAFRAGHAVRGSARAVAHRSVVPRADRGPGARRAGGAGAGPGSVRPRPRARAQAQGIFRSPPRDAARASTRASVRRRRITMGIRPVYKRVDTCAAEFATSTAYMYSTYDEECEAASDRSQEDHDSRRRAEPHRPGHRVRLLLRARRAGAARSGLRDDHGQLQSRDRLDRLRHVRPPVLRAADVRRRHGDHRQGKAGRRDRAVRRPDAAEAVPRAGGCRRADHRHDAGFDRHRRGPRALPAAGADSSA